MLRIGTPARPQGNAGRARGTEQDDPGRRGSGRLQGGPRTRDGGGEGGKPDLLRPILWQTARLELFEEGLRLGNVHAFEIRVAIVPPLRRQQLRDQAFGKPVLDDAARIADDDRVRRNVFRHHGGMPDDRAGADCHAGPDVGTRADPHVMTERDAVSLARRRKRERRERTVPAEERPELPVIGEVRRREPFGRMLHVAETTPAADRAIASHLPHERADVAPPGAIGPPLQSPGTNPPPSTHPKGASSSEACWMRPAACGLWPPPPCKGEDKPVSTINLYVFYTSNFQIKHKNGRGV